jgi:protein-L-isoaspartate(D-aspartate) O-methyltransferase
MTQSTFTDGELKRAMLQWAHSEKLVQKLKSRGHIRTPQVEAAFRAVPRHVFLPGVALDEVYSDRPIITKRLDGIPVSSSSQPSAMAIMLEQLGLEPGHRVLEVGAGTGYNAALMAHIVGDEGQVITVDIDEDIVESAREHLAAADLDRVEVVCGDGGLGYPVAAPYDRIILTVGAWDIVPAWWEQLKPNGLILVPLWIKGEERARLSTRREASCSPVSPIARSTAMQHTDC